MTGLGNLDSWLRRMREDVAGLEVPQDLAERFGRYRDDPVGFVRHALGVSPELYQEEVLRACAEEPRVAWRAAHGVGKTAALAWILLWWLLSRPFARVLVLAPAFERQVGRYLLPEVKKWIRNAPEALPVVVRANSVEVVGHEREWFALGVQATDATMVEGGHSESLCVLADEAKGLDSEVVAALHGTQTDVGRDRLYVLASVPGGPSGPFYDTFRKGSRLWRSFHTSAVDSGLVSSRWIEEREEEWGRGSPLFISRVEGNFPEEDDGTLFRLSDLEAAVECELEQDDEPSLRFGVDVARFGSDSSALAIWKGPELLTVETRRALDTMETASWVAAEINRQKPARVAVDEIGVGSGVVDRLRQLGHRVEAVNVGASAERSDLFANTRSEIFWRLREALEKGEVRLPRDDDLIAELAAFRFTYTANGKIALEPKEETKKRVGRSPDKADAMVLGFSVPPAELKMWFYNESPDDVKPQPLQVPAEGWFGPGTSRFGVSESG